METREGRVATPLYRYRWGAVEFDEARLELHVGGLAVELEQKPLQVLSKLLRHVDEVVTRKELLDTVWAGRITVEHVLNNAIVKLRKALSDEVGERIVTLPRAGYKLVGPVERTAVGRQLMSRLDLKAGMAVPGREHFLLQSQLGATQGSEVWLAQNAKTRELRVYKFSADGEHLAVLKREATLYRLLRESLGQRDDFVRILDWNFEHPPFYLECAYEGDNLATWATSGGQLDALSPRERLSLFLQIADAVAAAHSVGVLHKDLKPANVLIAPRKDGTWQIRVGDFGNGRLLEPGRLQELGISQQGLTVAENAPPEPSSGTLLYLAPELIAGQAPTVQSDVYALGLILYQLSVGDLQRPMAPGWERDIADELLREDIAAATDGNPGRRLATAVELAERLRRLESRRHERARILDAEQRALIAERKLERSKARRPWLITAGVSLIVGLAVSLGLYHAERLARRSAERAEARSEAINRFLNEDLLGTADPSGPGGVHDATVKELLAHASGRLEGRFADDPTVQASIELALGKAYFGVSDYASAEPHLRRAVALLNDAAGAGDPATLDAEYALGTFLIAANRYKEAEPLLDTADRNAGSRRDGNSLLAFHAHWARAHYYKLQLKVDNTLSEFETADRIRAVVDPQNDYLLFRIKDGLSWSYLRLGRNAEAEAVLRELISAKYTPERVGSLYWSSVRLDYGLALKSLQRNDEAERVMLAALKQIQAGLGTNHYFAALALNQLGDLYVSEGKLAEAAEPYRQCYEIFRKRVGEHAQATLVALTNLGILESQNGQMRTAIADLTRARGEFLASTDERNPMAQIVSFYLASTLADDGEKQSWGRAQGLVVALEPSALAAAEPGIDWPERLQALKGELLLRQGHNAEGQALLKPAVAKMERDGVQGSILKIFQQALAKSEALPVASRK